MESGALRIRRAGRVDNGGRTPVPMPDWLSEKGSTGTALTTQNLVDVFAYMTTQTQ